eukprot:m51a1_g8716 hypothetical protein (318) ;mRNA; f:158231-159683
MANTALWLAKPVALLAFLTSLGMLTPLAGRPRPQPTGERPQQPREEAYVVLALADSYVRLALGLQGALLRVGSGRPVVVLAGPNVSAEAAGALSLAGMEVRRVPQPPRHRNYRPRTPRFADLLSKLEAFRVPVERAVFLDLDTLLLGCPDDLFDSREPFVASQDDYGCDTARPGTVNSGLMFIRRDNGTYEGLLRTLDEGVFAGDQELIQKYWEDRLGRVTTLPVSYSTFHSRFSDWSKCRTVDQSFRKAKVIHLAAARVDWDAVARLGNRTPGLKHWARPFMQMFKDQNDAAGRRMLELAGRGGVDSRLIRLTLLA